MGLKILFYIKIHKETDIYNYVDREIYIIWFCVVWSYDVMVSIFDFESNNLSSNLSKT